MEKTGICGHRLYSAGSLRAGLFILLFFSLISGDLFSQNTETQTEKTLEVEVEVSIQGGDRASALDSAQNEAFRKAMSLVVPGSADDQSRANWIKSASTYVKSFRLLSEKEEAGKLITKYRVDLNLPDFSGQSSESSTQTYEDRFAVEFIWKDPKQAVSVTELQDKIEGEYSVNAGMIRMSRGSVWIELISRRSPESVFSQIKRDYLSVAQVKLYEDPYGFLGEGSSNAQQP